MDIVHDSLIIYVEYACEYASVNLTDAKKTILNV